MTTPDLKALLDDVPDTRELVLRAPPAVRDLVHAAWKDAHAEATAAYAAWRATGGEDAYAAYRAAQDRADAAQDAVVVTATP
jgi:hypothetical protein